LSGHKVKLATIDLDLKIRSIKRYPLSANGRHIEVCNGGENHFMPLISNTSYLHFPSWKRYYLFGERTHTQVYFAMNKAKKCIDFASGEVGIPSVEELKRANAILLATKIGQDTNKGTPWYVWFLLILVALSFFLQLQIAGVIR